LKNPVGKRSKFLTRPELRNLPKSKKMSHPNKLSQHANKLLIFFNFLSSPSHSR
jgi:hypothetical protein